VPVLPAAVYCMSSTSRSSRTGRVSAGIADTIRHRGCLGSLGYYAKAIFQLLRDLTPERRRSRYGDIDYDFDHGVDTTWSNVSLGTRLRELASGAQYQASEPELFHRILHALPVQPDEFTFVDLGSGKGRTLLMASDYPFHRIVGIELLAELNQIARKNIRAYFSERQRCFKIESSAGDARDFQFPQESLVLYLFNPFPDYVLRTVLTNLRRSFQADPREVYIIYHNLVHEDLFLSQSWLKQLHHTHQFAIYRADDE